MRTLTTLHSFDSADGANPESALIHATDGYLYGTTTARGANHDGTVYKFTPQGALTVLHSFDSTDGAAPTAPLIQATDGNFYGATSTGGANGDGTVFQMKSDGAIATLHSFDGTDGAQPFGGLVQATDGSFYGTTYYGGTQSYGAIYKLSIGLGPFVKAVPRFATGGTAVTILGTDLRGATNVSFNGTEATFTVVSATEITTSVPTGATSGRIQVTAPGGGLRTPLPFLVRP
jgi:uncharacterized repeat protein (TIGR03803 family)